MTHSRPPRASLSRPPHASAKAPKGNIKGAAFAEFLGWYETHRSRAIVLDALAVSEARFPGTFDPSERTFGILTSRWYAAESVHCVLDEIAARHTSRDLEEIATSAAEAIMTKTLRGVYRAMVGAFLTAERFSKHADKLWQLHYDTGHPVFSSPSATEHRIRYEGWQSHHPFICQLNMASARPLYAAMGHARVRYQQVSCVSNGAAYCENSIKWA